MFITAAARFVAANLNLANYIGGVSFRPDRDIPDLSGKVVLVTGGTSISLCTILSTGINICIGNTGITRPFLLISLASEYYAIDP